SIRINQSVSARASTCLGRATARVTYFLSAAVRAAKDVRKSFHTFCPPSMQLGLFACSTPPTVDPPEADIRGRCPCLVCGKGMGHGSQQYQHYLLPLIVGRKFSSTQTSCLRGSVSAAA